MLARDVERVKIEARDVEAVLRDSQRWGAVLLHGDDPGLVRRRARRIVDAAAGRADDPFRVIQLSGDDAKRVDAVLASELATMPLGGGRRVVRVTDAGDALAGAVQSALGDGVGGLLVLEAGHLPVRSKLRATCEKSAISAVIACYVPDARSLGVAVKDELRRAAVVADADALDWLVRAEANGIDGAVAEARKVALYVGSGGRVTLEDMRASIGAGEAARLEELLLAAMAGDVVRLTAGLRALWNEGVSPVGVLRAALLHFQRLRPAVRWVSEGRSPTDAARGIRPPVFYKQEGLFTEAVSSWRPAEIDLMLWELWQAERACKVTGAPAEAICSQALWRCAELRKALDASGATPAFRR